MSLKIPNEEECIQLLKDCKVPKDVITHSLKVCEVAEIIALKCNADLDLVKAGALLHDIGRSKTHNLMHAALGAEILTDHHLPQKIIDIVRKHTGAGFTNDEVLELNLPPADYMPSTLEEKIVCHADNLVAGTYFMTSKEKITKELSKGHDVTAKRIQAMHNELSSLCGIDLDTLMKK